MSPEIRVFKLSNHAPDVPGPVRALSWADAALCAQADPDLWFELSGVRFEQKANGEREAAAKSICRRCPVLAECRDYAMSDPSLHGIWGGLTAKERQAKRTRRTA